MQSGIRTFSKKLIFIVLTLLFVNIAWAQPPIQLPTQNNPQEVSPGAADPKSLTPTQLSSLLSDKNDEVGEDRNKNKKDLLDRDSSVSDNLKQSIYSPKNTYGADVFRYSSSTDLSELSTPPLDYPIGVGDVIIVALWGGADFQNEFVVARDGSIFPKTLGKIYVGGLTFENMRKVVDSRFRSVTPPETNIAISIGQPRSINVNVVGEVNSPGVQTVSAFSNAFSVIGRANGVNRFGNLRDIIIKRQGVVIDHIDVYKYLTTGDFGKHIYLQNNDFVIVGLEEKKVFATGQFKRPMYYQLKADEGVKALLRYSGGLTADALASNMKVIRSEDESQKVNDVNANAILKIAGQDFLLMDGDIVKVDLIKEGIVNKVELRGSVKYPDFYEIRKNDRLFDVINRAGGVTPNTYLQRAYIFRGAGDSTKLTSDRLEVDLTDFNDGITESSNNIYLEPNDVVLLFNKNEFADEQYVEIFGEVRKPGKVSKYGGMSLQDLLFLAGGLKPSAEFGRLEISSIVDVDSARKALKPTRTVVNSYAIDSELSLDSASSKVKLKPYDQVFVRKNPTFDFQKNITLRGLVKYPGLYPKLKNNERLSSYIDRAGGFEENANLSGAVLFRLKTEYFRENLITEDPNVDTVRAVTANSLEASKQRKMNDINEDGTVNSKRNIKDDKTRDEKTKDYEDKKKKLEEPVSIDLVRAMKYRNSKYDIILQEDDAIYVPEVNPFVSIQGRVQSEVRVTYDKENTNLMYYIDKAGGFGIRPWRSRVFVKYANGRSKRTKNVAFFHFYPRVKPGSIVYVPERPDVADVGDILKNVITAAIPVIATAFIFRFFR